MKIIHTADVHLGASPDMGYPWEAERSASLWTIFKRLIERVRTEKTDILLISGDLFHRKPTVEELKEVNYLFASIPETRVFLCAGNHDHMGGGNPYAAFSWSSNVTGFWSRELSSVSIPQKSVRVYGLSYYDNEAEVDLYSSVRRLGGEQYHILMLHGGDAKHSPVKKDRLSAMDIDYIAMGHIHKPGYVIRNKAVYSGALAPIDKNDTGEHGYISVTLSNGVCRAEFVPFSPFKYEDITVYSDESDTIGSLEDKIRCAIEDSGIENSYKLTVKGSGQAVKNLQLKRLWEYGHVLEISDETSGALDISLLSRRYAGTFLGEYINELSGREDASGRYALDEGVRIILEAMRQEGADI